MKNKSKNSLFKFRRYKKIEGGKKLIVEETKQEYGFMGLTESPKRGHHKNIELTKNPQKGNTAKSYIRDELRYDDKSNFGDILSDYNLDKKDMAKILKYLEKRKKKEAAYWR